MSDLVPAEPDAAGPVRVRRSVVLNAAAAAVATGITAVLLVGGSDEPALEPAVPGSAPAAAAPASPGELRPTLSGTAGDDTSDDAASPSSTSQVLPAFTGALGRNPFSARYVPVAEPAGVAVPPAVDAGAAGDGAALPDPAAGVSGPPADVEPAPPVQPVGGQPPAAPVLGPVTGSTDTPPPAPVTSSRRVLALLRVSGTAGELRAVFSLDGREQRAEVGGSFGATGELRLVAVQQGPADGQWTAVVQLGDGDPFDVVTGEAVAV